MKSCPLAVKCGFYHTSQYNPDTEERKSDMKFSSDGNLTLHGRENMASSKEYLQFILEQLSELEDITYRVMLGEFIIYYRGKIIGGIYDDRLLIKPVKSAVSYMPAASYERPYDGAKEMLLVDEVDNKEFLAGLFRTMYDELPSPKAKKKK